MQTLELSLAFELVNKRLKQRELNRALKLAGDHHDEDDCNVSLANLSSELDAEMDFSNIMQFNYSTDNLHKDAFVAVYSYPSSLSAVLDPSTTDKVLELAEKSFPLHYAAIHSMIFSKQMLKPSRRDCPAFQLKRKALANHFFCSVPRTQS